MITEEDWEPPKTLEEAYEAKRVLLAFIQDNQTQLGSPLKKQILGVEGFWEWRQKSKWALNYNLQRYRLLKSWIRAEEAKQRQKVTSKTKAK